jgi:hypothetical protein
MSSRKPMFYVLTACASLEFLWFFALCYLGREVFTQWVWTPDSPEYARVAQHLASTFQLTSSHRTVGYPLFLSLGYLIGGQDYWMRVAIGFQLILNLVFTFGCWRLLERMVPAVRARLRGIVTLFFFWAAFGMALFVLTDFLASFLFGMFLYGLLFWRTLPGVLLAGGSLALATLTRPTFTFLPFLLPISGLLVARITTKALFRDLVMFMSVSVVATGISVVRQYNAFGYLGPAPRVLTQNIETTLYSALGRGRVDGSSETSYANEFERDIGQRAGSPYNSLSFSEQESYAKQIFREELTAHPTEVIALMVMNFFKYLLVPVEANVLKATTLYTDEQTYFMHVRPILTLACLPIWLLSLTPPLGASKQLKSYYLLLIMLVLYVIGISAVTNFAGERMRFPVLAAMMPMLAWNAYRVSLYFHRLLEACRLLVAHD